MSLPIINKKPYEYTNSKKFNSYVQDDLHLFSNSKSKARVNIFY